MKSVLNKTSAGLLAIGIFAVTAPVFAHSPLPLKSVPILVPVQNVENEELQRDLDTAESPSEGKAEAPEAEGSENVENEELQRDLDTGETPAGE